MSTLSIRFFPPRIFRAFFRRWIMHGGSGGILSRQCKAPIASCHRQPALKSSWQQFESNESKILQKCQSEFALISEFVA